MKDPPDLKKTSNQQIFQSEEKKMLKTNTVGPKYLIMSRINSSENLSKVSPFLIKKVIDCSCGGEVEVCKKLRNGNILIKTKNYSQAVKLIKLISLCPTIEMDISEHPTLNFSKGVIYSNDLRGIPEEEIIKELSSQNVCDIKKIMKKYENSLCETGLCILTFADPALPTHLMIGYEKLRIRPYIPLPLRCMSCLRFGHTTKSCTNLKICINCAKNCHLDVETEEICTDPKMCINCIDNNIVDNNHCTMNKNCPIFLKEKEIQAIITLEKVDRKKATSTYKERHPQNFSTYASTAAINTASSSSTIQKLSNIPNLPQPTTISQRETINYSSLKSFETPSTSIISKKVPKDNNKKITILPKNTSKRTKDALKRKMKNSKTYSKQSNSKPNCNLDDVDSSDSMSLDIELP